MVPVLESEEPGLTSGPWPPSTTSPGTGDFTPPSSHGHRLHKGHGVDDGRLMARGCPRCSVPSWSHGEQVPVPRVQGSEQCWEWGVAG